MYKYEYKTLHDLLALAEKEKTTLSDIVVRHEVESSEELEEKVRAVMASRLDVFQESIDAGMKDSGKSVSGLVGGDAHKLAEKAPNLLGPLAHKAAVYALAVSEANAKMFKIVACPTAGSCGIVPAVMMAAAEEMQTPRPVLVDALFTAAGIGAVVSRMLLSPVPSAAARPNVGRLRLWRQRPWPKWPAAITIRFSRPLPCA